MSDVGLDQEDAELAPAADTGQTVSAEEDAAGQVRVGVTSTGLAVAFGFLKRRFFGG